MTLLRRIAALALLMAIVAACTVQLRTASAPSEACMMALFSGRLVSDPQSGLALQASTGEVTQVLWPYGYSARREPTGGTSLLDEKGNVIAHEGDSLEVGGGMGAQNLVRGLCRLRPRGPTAQLRSSPGALVSER